MLSSTLVSQWTSGVALSEHLKDMNHHHHHQALGTTDLATVLSLDTPSTDHAIVDAAVGGRADVVGHDAHLDLHQGVWVVSGAV